jgi:hypothetical protein
MPDLAGMSLRDAAQFISTQGWEFSVEGSGAVAEHWPRPNETLDSNQPVKVRLRLAPVQQRLKELAEAVAPALEIPQPGRLLLAQAPSAPEMSDPVVSDLDSEPSIRLRRGNRQVELAVMPIADTAAATRMRPTRQNEVEEFPAGQKPTLAAELDPPTPGLSNRVWSQYWEEEAAKSQPDAAANP